MRITPSQKQLEYQLWEFGVFFHSGIRTFFENSRDWDGSKMDISIFNPKSLDCENWILTAKNAGAKYAIMTAKHHDGFALWQSKFTSFSVANTPWKEGKGDVVKEFSDACEKYGIKKGLYYSPADYGFSDVQRIDYDEYFINQISELMTGYDNIDILWFDGCGSSGHTYDWKKIISRIRELQPEILIFNMGDPDISWVGNEAGIAPSPNFNLKTPDFINSRLDMHINTGELRTACLPAECDCMMCETTWFYNYEDEQTIKSVDRLMRMYYYSVGRGANLLLNIGPDKRGLLPDRQANRLLEFGNEIKRRFASPIADIQSFSRSGNCYTINFRQAETLNHVVLSENLMNGESIERFSIYCDPSPNATEFICVYEGNQIGHKAICMFPTIHAKSLYIKITKHSGDCELTGIGLFYVN